MTLRCQMPTRPSSTGMFSGSGALEEVLVHLVRAGQELGEVRSGPMAIITGRPTAPQTE